MATSDDSHNKHLQRLLTCAICLDLYKDPRILPCSHTFCFQCINNSVDKDKSSFSCPLRDEMIIDQDDIAQLPVNQTVKDMVEFLLCTNLSSDENSDRQCKNCDENKAVHWCEECNHYYCESCTGKLHSLPAFQSHAVVPAAEKMQSFCSEHPDEKYIYWCQQCEILGCHDCRQFQHRKHACLSLSVAASAAKDKFRETVNKLVEIKGNLMTFSKTTKDIIDQQHEVISRERQDIEQMFANLQDRLEERKRALIKQLEGNALQTTKILHYQKTAVDQLLNLTKVHELCFEKMLDSDNRIRILNFKSDLYQRYHSFEDQYTRIDEGYIMRTHLFKKDGRDIEQIADIISNLGRITSTARMVKRDSVTIKTSPLDISKVDRNTAFITKETNYARGYKFTLKKNLKLRSVQIHSDQVGQVTSFVVNDIGIVMQKSTINSTNATMKWLSIPIECDIQNNYSILVSTPSNNGSYTCKNGDHQPRIINENCSVESKYIHSVTQINVGAKMNVNNNHSAVDMILDIEDDDES